MSDFWKNKTILVYIALAHHTRFIFPVVEQLARQGAKVLYLVGQAERSQEITAINLGLEYTHVFDWVCEKDQDEIQENYQRLRQVFSNSLKQSYLYSTPPVTVTDKTIYSTAMEYVGFKNAIKKNKPDLCLALHELNRWGKMFAFWAKKFNVPILTFQEGLYYGMDYAYTGHLQHSTFNLVWGNRIKRKLADYEAPANRIIEVGNTHLAGEIKRQAEHGIRKKKSKEYQCENKLAILLLFSGEIPEITQLHPLFKAVAESKESRLFIKFHPAAKYEQVAHWISLIPKPYQSVITTFSGDDPLYDLLSMSDVVLLAQASTTGLEALFFGKPLVLLDIKMTQKLPYSFTEFNVAAKMTPQAFGTAVLKNKDFSGLTDPKDIDQYLKDELSGTKNAIERVVDISKQVIKANLRSAQASLNSSANTSKDWSIILELPQHPNEILRQLEALAVHSENSGSFEVILIEPPNLSKEAIGILDTLKGDLIRLSIKEGQTLTGMMNTAACLASGTFLIFMKDTLLPMKNWLCHLNSGIKITPRSVLTNTCRLIFPRLKRKTNFK
ncbi:MAG: glycosyltransferase [Desulfobacter sp.]|nr:glycosyltransferase [Desulfobacter sp.]WDP87238.1 MAG: glycosyltransferase [Desulfobacter sp.]